MLIPPPLDGGTSGGSGGGTGAGGGTPGAGGGSLGCDRAGLQAVVDSYLAAVQAGDPWRMPLAASPTYTEVTATMGTSPALGDGLWKTPLPIRHTRSLLDVTTCETFSELVVTESGDPRVIGTRLTMRDRRISEIYSIVANDDDWNFDATAYATCSETEDWSLVPPAEQSSREELIAAGQAYLDVMSDKNVVVPWGTPCYRLEGGKGCTPTIDSRSTTCNVGVPDGITMANTHWVADVEVNAVAGMLLFAGTNPDIHLFRLVDGKIRYVHTQTIMR